MERMKRLERCQKGILLLVMAMALVFTAAYLWVCAREGFAYKGVILIPSQENGNTVYSGKIQGKEARFTVYADETAAFQYGDTAYGPYTAREDSSAIPEDTEMGEFMTGVELRRGEEILFRGAVLDHGGVRLFFHEDGSLEYMDLIDSSAAISEGTAADENGAAIDPMEPSASVILDLMAGSEPVHKGEWSAWFGGVFLCIVTAVSILYADELFRWNLSFRIRDAGRAEPSDWEMTRRYIAWIMMPVVAMILFFMGLQ